MKIKENDLNLHFVCPYPHCSKKGDKVTLSLHQVMKAREYPRCNICSEKLAYAENSLYKEKCPRCKSTRIDPVGRGGKLCCDCKNVWGAD